MTYYASLAGSDSNDGSAAHPWLHVQHAMDFCRTDSVARLSAQTIQCADGHFPESLEMSGAGNAIYLKGNPANSRAVQFDGLQVRDSAVCLFYNITLPWFALDQHAIVDAYDFVLCSGSHPFGYQINANRYSTVNLNNYSVDAGGACGHMCASGSTIGQPSGASVVLADWLAYGDWTNKNTFYRAQFGGSIQLGTSIAYTNRDHVTAIPASVDGFGTIQRAGNFFPGEATTPVYISPGAGQIS